MDWTFADADSFHPAASIAKMRAGLPLTEADREPWLRSIADWIGERIAAGESAVVTCSALKRRYRELLTGGRPEVRLIFLNADRNLLARPRADRHGHFFPERLLDSQLDTLSRPSPRSTP